MDNNAEGTGDPMWTSGAIEADRKLTRVRRTARGLSLMVWVWFAIPGFYFFYFTLKPGGQAAEGLIQRLLVVAHLWILVAVPFAWYRPRLGGILLLFLGTIGVITQLLFLLLESFHWLLSLLGILLPPPFGFLPVLVTGALFVHTARLEQKVARLNQ